MVNQSFKDEQVRAKIKSSLPIARANLAEPDSLLRRKVDDNEAVCAGLTSVGNGSLLTVMQERVVVS